jgi:hypothetical protein
MGELKLSGKPFEISKAEVWEAYRKVKAKKGAAGVDGQTIEDFETDLKNNLYRIWNRMSSSEGRTDLPSGLLRLRVSRAGRELDVGRASRPGAVRAMEVGPPEPPCGGRFQTTHCCVS